MYPKAGKLYSLEKYTYASIIVSLRHLKLFEENGIDYFKSTIDRFIPSNYLLKSKIQASRKFYFYFRPQCSKEVSREETGLTSRLWGIDSAASMNQANGGLNILALLTSICVCQRYSYSSAMIPDVPASLEQQVSMKLKRTPETFKQTIHARISGEKLKTWIFVGHHSQDIHNYQS